MTHPRNFNWRKIPKDYNLSDWLSKYPQDDWVWQMIFHGGRVKTEASSYMITGLGNSRQTFSTSYLYLHVPLDWFLNNPSQDPTTLYIRWAEMMQAEHGTAGIGLIPAKDEIIKGETSRFAVEFSRIFPGAELCDPLSQSGKVLKGLLSVNWLNKINDHYIKELGGTEKIKHELQGTNAKIYLYDGGAVIAAGPQAELCEENELTIVPKSYQVAAKLLKPLRTTYGWGFWGANNENVLEWLARFDTK
ncbi:hypothetical protein GCM10022423_15480 [Flavobacterium ginsengiterrae]|uniref:Uncharacterized protein n=1 Tax=Flavobacterium ginsengiterrae TaxID=871695 RepID=A0ABP7GFS7_9FLAO